MYHNKLKLRQTNVKSSENRKLKILKKSSIVRVVEHRRSIGGAKNVFGLFRSLTIKTLLERHILIILMKNNNLLYQEVKFT